MFSVQSVDYKPVYYHGYQAEVSGIIRYTVSIFDVLYVFSELCCVLVYRNTSYLNRQCALQMLYGPIPHSSMCTALPVVS